ncbi:MAG: caspase family protein, partial [Myxococcales bacterium]|nr:caspase family protein [Myxococcales bacterium]
HPVQRFELPTYTVPTVEEGARLAEKDVIATVRAALAEHAPQDARVAAARARAATLAPDVIVPPVPVPLRPRKHAAWPEALLAAAERDPEARLDALGDAIAGTPGFPGADGLAAWHALAKDLARPRRSAVAAHPLHYGAAPDVPPLARAAPDAFARVGALVGLGVEYFGRNTMTPETGLATPALGSDTEYDKVVIVVGRRRGDAVVTGDGREIPRARLEATVASAAEAGIHLTVALDLEPWEPRPAAGDHAASEDAGPAAAASAAPEAAPATYELSVPVSVVSGYQRDLSEHFHEDGPDIERVRLDAVATATVTDRLGAYVGREGLLERQLHGLLSGLEPRLEGYRRAIGVDSYALERWNPADIAPHWTKELTESGDLARSFAFHTLSEPDALTLDALAVREVSDVQPTSTAKERAEDSRAREVLTLLDAGADLGDVVVTASATLEAGHGTVSARSTVRSLRLAIREAALPRLRELAAAGTLDEAAATAVLEEVAAAEVAALEAAGVEATATLAPVLVTTAEGAEAAAMFGRAPTARAGDEQRVTRLDVDLPDGSVATLDASWIQRGYRDSTGAPAKLDDDAVADLDAQVGFAVSRAAHDAIGGSGAIDEQTILAVAHTRLAPALAKRGAARAVFGDLRFARDGQRVTGGLLRETSEADADDATADALTTGAGSVTVVSSARHDKLAWEKQARVAIPGGGGLSEQYGVYTARIVDYLNKNPGTSLLQAASAVAEQDAHAAAPARGKDRRQLGHVVQLGAKKGGDEAQRKVSVHVGVSDHPFAPLPGARNDAFLMERQSLAEGYDADAYIDRTAAQIGAHYADAAGRVGEGDALRLTFSGHGRRSGALVGADDSDYAYGDLLGLVGAASQKGAHTEVIIDACHSGRAGDMVRKAFEREGRQVASQDGRAGALRWFRERLAAMESEVRAYAHGWVANLAVAKVDAEKLHTQRVQRGDRATRLGKAEPQYFSKRLHARVAEFLTQWLPTMEEHLGEPVGVDVPPLDGLDFQAQLDALAAIRGAVDAGLKARIAKARAARDA